MPAPFRIAIPQDQRDDLAARLARTRLTPALSDDWTHGTPPGYLAELVTYWRERFDWAAAEQALNALPQFTTEVHGDTLHFVHAQGTGPAPFPLLFSHGWPGSFWEVHKILGPLTDPAAHGGDPADAFHVVAPSLPGYGFSPHPGRPGIDPSAIGDLFDGLMRGLGYTRYGAQGGDWGAMISTALGREHGDTVAGIHLNMSAARPDVADDDLTAAERSYLAEARAWQTDEAGYGHIQSSKPATIGAALADSPAGLAAWITEKFRTWSDCDGDVESVFSKDDLLTNIALYWFTNTAATSARLYYERAHSATSTSRGYVSTPTGFARFPKEISVPPREWIERCYNLTHYTEFDHGGHFAALERPADLVEDIRAFFRPLR